MKMFDIFIAYVSWGVDGKKRPVLIMDKTIQSIIAFNITTKYDDKSEIIRSRYFKIKDWQKAGLNKQSYIDTNDVIALPVSSVDDEHQIGRLTETDMECFINFMQI